MTSVNRSAYNPIYTTVIMSSVLGKQTTIIFLILKSYSIVQPNVCWEHRHIIIILLLKCVYMAGKLPTSRVTPFLSEKHRSNHKSHLAIICRPMMERIRLGKYYSNSIIVYSLTFMPVDCRIIIHVLYISPIMCNNT